MPQAFELHFIEKKQESEDSFSFYFDRKAYFDRKNHPFDFLPGQYIKMFLDVENPDDRGNSRFFSIASSPTEKDYIFITTRIIQSTFKMALVGLQVGTPVKFIGPFGNFVLREEERKPKVFVAGGIGATPFRSMIKYSQDKNLQDVLYLFNSFKGVKDIPYYAEMSVIRETYPVFNYIPTVTENKTPDWAGETGRINSEMIKRYVKDVNIPIFYIAGPEVMVEALSKVIADMGVASENIRSESFPGY